MQGQESLIQAQILALWAQPQRREEAFRLLVRHYAERLYATVRQRLPEHEAANEVVQDTLIKAYRGLDNFRGEALLSTWLHRIALNALWSYLEREKKHRHLDISDLPLHNESANQTAQALDSQAIEALLQAALATLPEKQRLVFELRYYQDLPYREMSALLQTSEGALKASYHHAAKKIEDYLKANHGF